MLRHLRALVGGEIPFFNLIVAPAAEHRAPVCGPRAAQHRCVVLDRGFRHRLAVRLYLVAQHVVRVVRPARRHEEVGRGGPRQRRHPVAGGIRHLEIVVGVGDPAPHPAAVHAEGHRERSSGRAPTACGNARRTNDASFTRDDMCARADRPGDFLFLPEQAGCFGARFRKRRLGAGPRTRAPELRQRQRAI